MCPTAGHLLNILNRHLRVYQRGKSNHATEPDVAKPSPDERHEGPGRLPLRYAGRYSRGIYVPRNVPGWLVVCWADSRHGRHPENGQKILPLLRIRISRWSGITQNKKSS
jgi:hypothetical protein